MSNTPTKACHTCGSTDQPTNHGYCPHCLATGHIYRMMTVDELRARATRNHDLGYHDTGMRISEIATKLDALQREKQ